MKLLTERILGWSFFLIAVPCISLLLASSGISIYFMALFGIVIMVTFIKWENDFSKKIEKAEEANLAAPIALEICKNAKTRRPIKLISININKKIVFIFIIFSLLLLAIALMPGNQSVIGKAIGAGLLVYFIAGHNKKVKEEKENGYYDCKGNYHAGTKTENTSKHRES